MAEPTVSADVSAATASAVSTESARDPERTTARPGPAGEPVAAVPAPESRYVLGEEIARGGMGAIHRAFDRTLNREVAVKVLQPKYAGATPVARRFADEAQITAQLQHPNIPAVHDLGTLPDGRPFLAMKLIRGETLHALLAARPSPGHDRGRFLAAFESICQAVAYAHAHGVLHRDLKPQNVMVGAFGEVQVMDWGLARVLRPASGTPTGDPDETMAAVAGNRGASADLTQAGSILGTPAYMPPEQAIGAVDQIDRRSDVFGLGGILAAILTGKPPFVGTTQESARQLAAQGRLGECLARLDASQAEPELVALCKKCLSADKADRPADADAVANAVAAFRAAAAERARQAEIDRVRLEGTLAAATERRKRRRVWYGAAAALLLATVGGLAAVLTVQRQANAALAAKNADLETERGKAEQRFELARKAVANFHTTIEDQPELGNEAFRPLRDTLLKSAAEFYRELERVLVREAAPRARAALADGYRQLAGLTETVGDQPEALAVYRRCLDVRRELAANADPDARLAVAHTLRRIAQVMLRMGDRDGATAALAEARGVAEALDAQPPPPAVREELAANRELAAKVLAGTGRWSEALPEFEAARDLRRTLADERPTAPEPKGNLARSYQEIGFALGQTGKPAEALAALQTARDLRLKLIEAQPNSAAAHADLAQSFQSISHLHERNGRPAAALPPARNALKLFERLAELHPAVTRYQIELATAHRSIGFLLAQTRQPAEALAEFGHARAALRKLTDAHPTVPNFPSELAITENDLGNLLAETGQPEKALAAHRRALELRERLTRTYPGPVDFRRGLGQSQHNLGLLLAHTGDFPAAKAAYDDARATRTKLADEFPANPQYQRDLALTLNNLGWLSIRLGRPDEALKVYELSRDVRQKLADANPTVASGRADLAMSHNNIGRLLAAQGQFAKAFEALNAGLKIRQELADTDRQANLYTNHLGFSYAYRGWARTRSNQPKLAATDLRQALLILDRDPTPSLETRFEIARARAVLAKLAANPRSGVTAAEAKDFADGAVGALAAAVNGGWAVPLDLAEPDFDAIRDRADFQKLLTEVNAKAPKPSPELAPPPRPAD